MIADDQLIEYAIVYGEYRVFRGQKYEMPWKAARMQFCG
jgi:hypothetical protein